MNAAFFLGPQTQKLQRVYILVWREKRIEFFYGYWKKIWDVDKQRLICHIISLCCYFSVSVLVYAANIEETIMLYLMYNNSNIIFILFSHCNVTVTKLAVRNISISPFCSCVELRHHLLFSSFLFLKTFTMKHFMYNITCFKVLSQLYCN